MSSTGRIRNVKDSQGRHILSPRLGDGGLSLTDEGAKLLHALELEPEHAPATLTVVEDAVPFVGAGRNVMQDSSSTLPAPASGRSCLCLTLKAPLSPMAWPNAQQRKPWRCRRASRCASVVTSAPS